MNEVEEKKYMGLLIEFRDMFAWSYKEMPGLDPRVMVYHLSVKWGIYHIKQTQQWFIPELILLIEAEVKKLIEASSFEKSSILHGFQALYL